jgi:predicted nucleic acid-binding protein
VENRSHVLEVTKEEKFEIKRAYDFILDYARNVHPGVSKVDALCLAHAEQLHIPVATDDDEMRTVAGAYGITTCKTLELMNYPAASYGVSKAPIRNGPFAASCGELTRMRLK